MVLAGKSPEYLLRADPVLGEVDRIRPLGYRLGQDELAEGAVRPGRVVVLKVLGQQLSQVVLIDDQQPAGKLPAQVPIVLSQIAFAPGACGGLATILMPSAVNTASKEPVKS